VPERIAGIAGEIASFVGPGMALTGLLRKGALSVPKVTAWLSKHPKAGPALLGAVTEGTAYAGVGAWKRKDAEGAIAGAVEGFIGGGIGGYLRAILPNAKNVIGEVWRKLGTSRAGLVAREAMMGNIENLPPAAVSPDAIKIYAEGDSDQIAEYLLTTVATTTALAGAVGAVGRPEAPTRVEPEVSPKERQALEQAQAIERTQAEFEAGLRQQREELARLRFTREEPGAPSPLKMERAAKVKPKVPPKKVVKRVAQVGISEKPLSQLKPAEHAELDRFAREVAEVTAAAKTPETALKAFNKARRKSKLPPMDADEFVRMQDLASRKTAAIEAEPQFTKASTQKELEALKEARFAERAKVAAAALADKPRAKAVGLPTADLGGAQGSIGRVGTTERPFAHLPQEVVATRTYGERGFPPGTGAGGKVPAPPQIAKGCALPRYI
jgi:ribosomal protein L29